jgi:hypothetical protein
LHTGAASHDAIARQVAVKQPSLMPGTSPSLHVGAVLVQVIAPVQAPLVSDHVFYMQEMAGDDPRRVLSQRLYVVDAVPDSEMSVLAQLDFTAH